MPLNPLFIPQSLLLGSNTLQSFLPGIGGALATNQLEKQVTVPRSFEEESGGERNFLDDVAIPKAANLVAPYVVDKI
jgi:hypothetical protein